MTRHLLILVSCGLIAACGGDGGERPTETGADAGDQATDSGAADADGAQDAQPDTNEAQDSDVAPTPSIAEELGITLYLDRIDPIEESSDGAETTYTFDPAQGPMCLRGDPFRTGVRDTGSEDLIIFLQGGGACWSEFCLAVNKAPPGVPRIDILDPDMEANPVRGWNAVYLPYCDGSFFAGDKDHDDDGDGTPERFHRGLQNLTGALKVAHARFPEARRVLFAGSSAGAYGTLLGTALVRHLWPEAELIVMADSGQGLGKPGDEAFLTTILDEFNLARFVPECDDCGDGGHLTGVVGWYLAQDPEVRVGLFSSWYDGVLGDVFLQVPGAAFRDALRAETDPVHAAYPDRYRRFIVDGVRHTTLLGDPSGIIGTDLNAVELPDGALEQLAGGALDLGSLEDTELDGLRFSVWLEALIEGDREVWVDVQAAPGEPPY